MGSTAEGEQAERGETDIWQTPKAEIMTHQGFQKEQKEMAFVLSSPSSGQ